MLCAPLESTYREAKQQNPAKLERSALVTLALVFDYAITIKKMHSTVHSDCILHNYQAAGAFAADPRL
jgi:hypothetical protein